MGREPKKTTFRPAFFDDKEFMDDIDRSDQACGGVLAGFPHDPTNGAGDYVDDALERLSDYYSDPLSDQSIRDDEVKDAILRNFKRLLNEEIERLTRAGY